MLDDLNRAAQAAWPVVSGRHLDRFARHHRRHGGQQFLRRALAALRQYARERALDRRRAGRRHARRISGRSSRTSPTCPTTSPLKPLAQDLLALGAREADAVEAALPAGAAPGRRLQSRLARAGAQRAQSRAYPGRLRGHARVSPTGSSSSSRRCSAAAPSAPAISAASSGAMEAAQHIVKLGPIAVELIDRTMLGLAREIAMFQPTIRAVRARRSRGDSVRRVWRGGRSARTSAACLRLSELIGDLGYRLGQERRALGRRGRGARSQPAGRDRRGAHRRPQRHDVDEGGGQAGLLRRGLRGAARASRRLHRPAHRRSSSKHGTRGTWYAHASVGCLHVRPVLNLRLEKDVKAMRAIAEEAFALVRAYKGSHSGEHGDGIVRSEFHESMFGARLVRAFEEVKDRFDPKGLFNPGKIVRAPKFDDRSLFRYAPDYHAEEITTQLDWSAYPGAGGGFQGAVEMCNNNGACRCARRRRHVPELPRHARGARRDARARQYAAACASPASSGPMRSPPTRWRRRSSSASRARRAGANARPASTWRA